MFLLFYWQVYDQVSREKGESKAAQISFLLPSSRAMVLSELLLWARS